jgi:hypothetical protein
VLKAFSAKLKFYIGNVRSSVKWQAVETNYIVE